MTHTYTPAESALAAAARAVLTEQPIAGGVIPIPGTSMIVAFGEREQIARLAAPSTQPMMGRVVPMACGVPDVSVEQRPMLEPSAQQAAGSIAELVKPTARFMWTSLLTNTATGIKFSLGTDKRGDVDVMSNELLESPEIDAAKVYEVAVLKRADYEIILNELDMVRSLYEGAHADRMALAAATPAQPIAVSAPTEAIYENYCKELVTALKRLSLAAQTSGGTAGRDEDLFFAIGQAEQALSYAAASRAIDTAARAAAPVSGPTEQDTQATAINPPAFPKYMADMCASMTKEEVWQYGCLTGWRSAAPVSGQGASIGDDAEFRAQRYRTCLERVLNCNPSDRKHWRAAAEDALQNLPATGSIRDDMGFVKVLCDYNCARVAETNGDVEAEYAALCAYIDSRPRSEDSRAKVRNAALEEAAKLCFDRAEEYQAKLDNCDREKLEAVRADVLQRRNEASVCSNLIRALATSAAPERSGEIAGYQKKYLCTISNDVWSDWEETSEKYYLECMKYPCANVQVRPVYAAPEADSSSAAPSEIAGLVVRDVCELSYEGEFNPETMMVVSAEDLMRIVSRYALAAPAPTGESLGATDYKLQDGETIRYARIGNIEGSLGGPFMTDSDQHGVWDVAMVFKAGNKRPSKIFLDQFYHCAALATPRQTEDGGLSAATVRTILVKHLGWVGGPEWTDEAQAICTDLASTFAPKEPAAQGGVPELTDEQIDAACDEIYLSDYPKQRDFERAIARAVLAAAPTGASK